MTNPAKAPLRVLSLGAGVQSTTLLLMSLSGVIPAYDLVIFADTQWEPKSVYDHINRLQAEVQRHGQEIVVRTAGNIRADHINPSSPHLFIRKPRKRPELLGKQRTFIPFFVTSSVTKTSAPTTDGLFDLPEASYDVEQNGHTYRTCTATYKIEVVEREIRARLGLVPYQNWPTAHVVDQTIGISLDETERMRDSSRPAIRNQYPLIGMRMTRSMCQEWMAERGWSAPRSACIGCPFHRNDEWRRMKNDDPQSWQDAIEFDETFRERQRAGLTALDGVPYLHDSRVPLKDVDLGGISNDPNQAQLDTWFGPECSGLCGT